LKEEHARCPDCGAAAEPREDETRDQRLDEEEQTSSPEDGQAKGEHGTVMFGTPPQGEGWGK
jgi:hypothetical protein